MAGCGALRSSIVALALVIVTGCAGNPSAPISERSEKHGRVPSYHVVRKGETLYSISWSYGRDFRKVARWNGIGPPYTIYPGQKIRLHPRKSSSSRRTTTAKASPPPKSSPPEQRVAKRSRDSAAHTARAGIAWQWPTSGKVLRAFSANDSGKKGIDIGGRSGAPVVAAAAGEVVYSGSGLIRYGKLIIIKHSHTLFSAYAHNRKLLVKEGDRVRAGQGIAEMGNTGTDRTMLHFEIRRDGDPVDPMGYLPKR